MNKHSKILLVFSGLFGAISIAMGALGAHAFHAVLVTDNHMDTFAKAVDYAMYGALSLLAVTALQQLLPHGRFFLSGYLLLLGTLLFSGSLFAYIFSGIKVLTILTPWGGISFIFAWLLIIISAIFIKE